MDTLISIISPLLLIYILSLVACLRLWWLRRNYFREQFALSLIGSVAAWFLFAAASLTSGLMPWNLPKAAASKIIYNYNYKIPASSFSDYALVLLLCAVYFDVARRIHKRWSGLKSVDQYKREQRNEALGLQGEAFLELRRLVLREPSFHPHLGYKEGSLVTQLQPVGVSVAWKERARDLVRLSSSSYVFDRDEGWRDSESCWVGTNLDRHNIVLLHPAHTPPNEEKLNALSRYAAGLAQGRDKDPRIIEIITALSGEPRDERVVPYEAVRYVTEASLLRSLVDFTDYINEMRRRVMLLTLPEANLRILDTYVDPAVKAEQEEGKWDLESYVAQWLLEPGQRQLALLGEYGQGKSTAALMFTFRALCSGELKIERIPILIELRGTSPRNLDPLQLLGAWGAKYNINPQALMQLHLAGRLLLIFEGFDEMALVGDAEMRLRHFKTIWDFCFPRAKIIITGRPNFFLDEEERKSALGIARPVGDRPYCEALRLSPFSVAQIREALRAQPSVVRDRICTLAEQDARFRELVSRPSLLHIVSVLWEREDLSSRVGRLTSAYLMDLFIRFSYRRQGLKETEAPIFSALTTSERAYFMGGVATYMAAKGLPNQISGGQLNDCIDLLLEAIPESVSLEADAISGESRRPLRFRLKGEEFGRESVKTDVRACGLLVDDPATPGAFRFGHKSFLEYLFAEHVAEKIRDSKKEAPFAVMKACEAKVEDILHWPVALEFVAELLGESPGDLTNQGAAKDEDYRRATRLFSSVFGTRNRLSLGIYRFQALLSLLALRMKWRAAFMLLPLLTFFVILFRRYMFVNMKMENVLRGESRTLINALSLFGMVAAFAQVYFLRLTMFIRRRVRLWQSLCDASKISIQAQQKVLRGALSIELHSMDVDVKGSQDVGLQED